ncbi:hypothetical protein [Rothia sp. LK2492]|uniref:hypothetical protein n=1 Tax=Rothia sp. LK2492 TaxID=3114370 RepID=UPI0034CF8278
MTSPLDSLAALDGLVLNSSQAAIVAGVERAVVPTWAKRHADFPTAQRGAKTLYSALEFVEWCAKRPAQKPLEQILADAAVLGGANECSGLASKEQMHAFLVFSIIYEQIEFRADERPAALLRRCAAKSQSLAELVKPYLLTMSTGIYEVLNRVGALVARYSEEPLNSFQLFLAVNERGSNESMHGLVGEFLADLLSELGTGLHFHFPKSSNDDILIQLAQVLVANNPDGVQSISFAEDVKENNGLLRLFQVFLSADSLYSSYRERQLEEAQDASTIVTYLPLTRRDATYELYWKELSQVVDGSPEGVPIVVLGRSDLLTSPVRDGSQVSSAHTDMLRYGHMVAVVDLGPGVLRSESNVPLAVAIFENHRVGPDNRPRVAVLDLGGGLGQRDTRWRAVIHDMGALVQEDWSSAMHSSVGEHTLVSGQYVVWREISEHGAYSHKSVAKPGQQRVSVINSKVREIQTTNLQPLSLDWRVAETVQQKHPTIAELIGRRAFKRVPGYAQSTLPAGLVRTVEAKDGGAWVRLLDEDSMARLGRGTTVPTAFRALKVADLAQLGNSANLALPGDVVVSEHSAETFVVGAEFGLVLVQAPLFILRSADENPQQVALSSEVFARLVRAGLQEQKLAGAQKALAKEVRVPPAVLKAFTGAVAENDSLETELAKIKHQRQALAERLAALEELEQQTLAGLSEGTITFLEKGI